MSAMIIDGRAVAQRVRDEVKARVLRLGQAGITPRLDVVLVGHHPPSQIYVKYKERAAQEVGVETQIHRLPESIDVDVLRAHVQQLNASPQTHGILIQLPLPDHISSEDTWSIVEEVSPSKDVDGLHPLNQGLIGLSDQGFTACTPLGCLTLLEEGLTQCNQGTLTGKHVVVIGRSRIVGRPLAQLMTAANATVTVCHSRTENLEEHIRQADIVIAAAGVPYLVKGSWIKPDAIVIDVGIHRRPEGGLCGDVDFQTVSEVAAAITPVPGGVGPMTIASLLHNVSIAAERAL